MRIVAVGDIMPGGILNKSSEEYASPEIINILRDGDVRVGTLETAVGDEPRFNIEKMNRKADVIYVEDNDIKRLKELDVNVVSLANNHFTDLGNEGIQHAISLLDSLNILHCGAGMNLEEASKPAVVVKDGKSYAFVGFCDCHEENVGWCPLASKDKPGVNPLYEKNAISQIINLKKEYDYVVVMPHWGKEYLISPTKGQYRLAKKMIKAGADLILGSHTHCIQPIFKYFGKYIVFGMGNFLFPDRLLTTPRSTFYCDSTIDIQSLPVTYGYPKRVDKVTLKKWGRMAQYGMIVSIETDNNSIHTYISHLMDGRYTELFNDDLYYLNKLRIIDFTLKMGVYPYFHSLVNVINSINLKLRTK